MKKKIINTHIIVGIFKNNLTRITYFEKKISSNKYHNVQFVH